MREFFTKEWFPQCMAIGITWEQFWEMNPRIVNAHIEGHKLFIKEQNALYHLEGAYTVKALEATVGNMFKKKGVKAIEYPAKPFDLEGASNDSPDGMTEEEKRRKTELLFGKLRIMQANFELSKRQSTNTRGEE